VIPKQETDYIFDLDDEALAAMHVFAKKVAKGVKKAVPCKRIGMAVIGLEVPHAHIHLVPMNEIGDLNFANKRRQFSNEEYAQTASRISNAIT
jgi:histidine triad (HIT) family protein